MQIRLGYELVYECPQPTPMLLMLNVHHTRVSDLVVPDHLVTSPSTPIGAYRDGFGNWCSRIVAPTGRTRLSAKGIVNDTGEPDVVATDADQRAVEDLPDDASWPAAIARPTDFPRSHGRCSGRRRAAGAVSRPSATTFTSTLLSAYIYSFAAIRKKIEWMRATRWSASKLTRLSAATNANRRDPRPISRTPDTPEFHRIRVVAHDLLAKTAMWWDPGYVKTLHQGAERLLELVYFRISINEISGYQGLSAA
jgi:hypothetical protein